jgi:hypothetical protein
LPTPRDCKFSLIALALALGMYATAIIWRINYFEGLLAGLARLEAYQLDELLLALAVLLPGVLADFLVLKFRRRRQREVERQRLKVLKATMNTVQDIVNNFLNSMQYFRFLAEKGNVLDPKVLAMLDDLIFDTSAKLTALAELESTPERKVGEDVVLIDYRLPRSARPDQPPEAPRR